MGLFFLKIYNSSEERKDLIRQRKNIDRQIERETWTGRLIDEQGKETWHFTRTHTAKCRASHSFSSRSRTGQWLRGHMCLHSWIFISWRDMNDLLKIVLKFHISPRNLFWKMKILLPKITKIHQKFIFHGAAPLTTLDPSSHCCWPTPTLHLGTHTGNVTVGTNFAGMLTKHVNALNQSVYMLR